MDLVLLLTTWDNSFLLQQHTKMVCPSHSYIYRVLKQCRSIHESQCSVKICKQMPRGCSSCDTGLLMWDQVFGKLDISQSVDLGHDRGTSVSKGGFWTLNEIITNWCWWHLWTVIIYIGPCPGPQSWGVRGRDPQILCRGWCEGREILYLIM